MSKSSELRQQYELIAVDRIRSPMAGAHIMRPTSSIKTVGLLQPITVSDGEVDGKVTGGRGRRHYRLIFGRHRLEAYRAIGHATIPARVVWFVDDVDRRLRTIAENLHRSELTVDERAAQVAEWIRLTEAKISAQLAPKLETDPPPEIWAVQS